jgi:hypothetical protein
LAAGVRHHEGKKRTSAHLARCFPLASRRGAEEIGP